tara:strand:+ start:182 stop:1012 length:831 start_codon:yes stop_codon:yes gene_type:complete
MDRVINILNLGAGVQSTALLLMSLDGDLDIEYDYAIFADTGDEPEDVYTHLKWLQSLGGKTEIIVKTAGCLGDDLINGTNSTGQLFASIPAFTLDPQTASKGMLRRQCTAEYKINVVEKAIRRDILKLKPRQRVPKDVTLIQHMGFSYDEPGRAARARGRFEARGWSKVRFPLIEDYTTRHGCILYLEKRVPHNVPRSACVFCPYKSNREWLSLKQEDPKGWARAVEVDEAIRNDKRGKVTNELYLHRTCKPLKDCHLDEDQLDLFSQECEGGCGL